MAKKYIEAEQLKAFMYTSLTGNDLYTPNGINEFVDGLPTADVVEANAFRNEVYRYIDDYKDDGADFLAGLETAVVIAEKMAGVYEEVDEVE